MELCKEERLRYEKWNTDGKPWPKCLLHDDSYNGSFCVGCGCCEENFIEKYGRTALSDLKRDDYKQQQKNRCLTD